MNYHTPLTLTILVITFLAILAAFVASSPAPMRTARALARIFAGGLIYLIFTLTGGLFMAHLILSLLID